MVLQYLGRNHANLEKSSIKSVTCFRACHQSKILKDVKVTAAASQSSGCLNVTHSLNAKNPRAYDKHLYKARHLIENFFAKLKQYRAIATRYDKTARNFLGAIHLAASVIWPA